MRLPAGWVPVVPPPLALLPLDMGIGEAAEGNAGTVAPYSPAGVPPREVPSSSITSLSWISPSM